jgi:hypothetical protein
MTSHTPPDDGDFVSGVIAQNNGAVGRYLHAETVITFAGSSSSSSSSITAHHLLQLCIAR